MSDRVNRMQSISLWMLSIIMSGLEMLDERLVREVYDLVIVSLVSKKRKIYGY